jgi:uncharacterized integral membrane protein
MAKLILYIIGLGIVVLFIMVNANQRVQLNLVFTTLRDAPLGLVCLLTFAFGVATTVPFVWLDTIRQRKRHSLEIKRLNLYLDATKAELKAARRILKENPEVTAKDKEDARLERKAEEARFKAEKKAQKKLQDKEKNKFSTPEPQE